MINSSHTMEMIMISKMYSRLIPNLAKTKINENNAARNPIKQVIRMALNKPPLAVKTGMIEKIAKFINKNPASSSAIKIP